MKYLKYGLSACVSVLILAFLFTQVPFREIVSVIGHSQAWLFFFSVIVGAISIIINTVRWKVLLKYLGYEYGLKFLSKLSFMTLFFNVYLPAGIVGDVARVAILPNNKSSKEERGFQLSRVTASVITDRVAGLAGLMLLAFVGFVFCYKLLLDPRILLAFSAITFAVVAVFLVLFSRRAQSIFKNALAFPLKALSGVRAVLKSVAEALFVYRDNPSVFCKVIALSILGNLCVVGYFFLLARSIGVNISFMKLLAFVPVIEFIASLPISIGGAGIRETITILLFSSEGIPAVQAMSVSLLSFSVLLLLGATGGVLFLFRRMVNNNK